MLDITAEVTALRDAVLNPADLGTLFSMVPGLPPAFATQFATRKTWGGLWDVLDNLLDYCEKHGITVIM